MTLYNQEEMDAAIAKVKGWTPTRWGVGTPIQRECIYDYMVVWTSLIAVGFFWAGLIGCLWAHLGVG